MRPLSLVQAVQAKIKTLSDYGDRVFIVPSIVGLVLMESYEFPLVGVIYRPGNIEDLARNHYFEHEVDVVILQSNWKEQEVVIGNSSRKGLLKLYEELFALLKDETFDSSLDPPMDNVFFKKTIGIKDYKAIGGQGLSALIGFTLVYQESV